MLKKAYSTEIFNDAASPEQMLWMAVIERVILDATSTKRLSIDCGNRVKKDALKWVLNWREDDIAEVGTFVWVCENAGLEPNKIRNIVIKALENGTIYTSVKSLNMYKLIKKLEY